MTKVTVDLSMSLDGFVAGPEDDVERLHEWLYVLESWRERHGLQGGERSRDDEILDEALRDTGAVVMGRRMFSLAERAWGDDPPFRAPVFVVAHDARETLVRGETTFEFVPDGVAGAVDRAREAAGERDVSIAGGASIAGQALAAGLVDELQIHLVPVLLGGGVRLFDRLRPAQLQLEQLRVVESPGITHMKFRPLR